MVCCNERRSETFGKPHVTLGVTFASFRDFFRVSTLILSLRLLTYLARQQICKLLLQLDIATVGVFQLKLARQHVDVVGCVLLFLTWFALVS